MTSLLGAHVPATGGEAIGQGSLGLGEWKREIALLRGLRAGGRS